MEGANACLFACMEYDVGCNSSEWDSLEDKISSRLIIKPRDRER